MQSPTAPSEIAIAVTHGKEPAGIRSMDLTPPAVHLASAIDTFNKVSINEFEAATSTRYLGADGPIYGLGAVLARGLFIGNDGRHWGDGALIVESLNHGAELTEAYSQALCDPELPIRDLLIYTESRGRWNGLVGPLDDIAQLLHLPTPVRAVNAPWAREWSDSPNRTDRQELGWIASGGKPMAAYRTAAW